MIEFLFGMAIGYIVATSPFHTEDVSKIFSSDVNTTLIKKDI